MTIRRVVNDTDFEKVATLMRASETREYDCSVDNYIGVVKSIYRKPWVRLWLVVDDAGDGAAYIWVTYDTTTLRDQVDVGDMYVRPEYRKNGVMEAMHNVLCEWAYGKLKAKRIRFESQLGLEAWQRCTSRLKHGITIKPVNCYTAEGAKEWVE